MDVAWLLQWHVISISECWVWFEGLSSWSFSSCIQAEVLDEKFATDRNLTDMALYKEIRTVISYLHSSKTGFLLQFHMCGVEGEPLILVSSMSVVETRQLLWLGLQPLLGVRVIAVAAASASPPPSSHLTFFLFISTPT